MFIQTARSSLASTIDRASRSLQRRPKKAWYRSDTLIAYLFLMPYLSVLLLFSLFVALYGMGLSFFRIDLGFTGATFVGFKNYLQLLKQLGNPGLSDFWTSMGNILKFTLGVVTGQTLMALLMALLLQTIKRGKSILRTMLYIPAVTSSVATSLIFLWLYNPNGVINYLLSLIGIHGPDWLNNVFWALPALMLLNVWSTAATFMLYFMAALQDLPGDVLEAASVDGAGRLQLFWFITLPLLRPTLFLVVALGTIGSFQMFDQAKFMTNGQPLNSTLTPMLEIYNEAFSSGGFGQAAAMSVILFACIFMVTMIQRRFIDTGSQP